MPAERARALPEEEEDGYEPSFSSASALGAAPAARSAVAPSTLAPASPTGEGLGSALPAGGPAGTAVMIGTHFHSLDEKGRVIIPAKMRAALTDQFWMMLDQNDNVGIYPYATGMDILEHCERMTAEHPEDEDIAAAVMRITAAADLVMVEGAFRVLVPDILRYYAGMDKEVVTVGALNHAVLWSREKWEEAHVSKPITEEVRSAQASLMRAAASGARRNEQDEAARRAEEAAQQQALERAHERALQSSAERAAERAGGRGERIGGRKAASSGDGARGAGVLKMSDLGR